MTYDARESGIQTGEPVELYEFQHGAVFYRYTSADTDAELGGNVFESCTLTRNAIEASQELARGALKLTMARTLPIVQLFNPLPPSDVITAKVYRFHRGDSESVVIWMGRILSIGLDGLQANMHLESVYSSIKRPGLRRLYQRQCPHVLYSSQCGVSRAAYKVTREVLAVSGLAITLDDMGAFVDPYFAGGYVEWITAAGATERRAIRSQSGAVVQINFQALGLAVGDSLDLYPGCDHSLETCDSKYGNGPNYGGMPYIPSKNPFDGTPVF